MDAKKFLETWKRLRKEELRTDCIFCVNRDRSIQKRGLCVCNSEENLVDCMIRYVDELEKRAKETKKNELTEQKKTAIKGRIAEGNLWATVLKGISIVYFSKEKPIVKKDGIAIFPENYTTGDRDFYNFIEDETVVYLPDLL